MADQVVTIIDRSRTPVAVAQVTHRDELFRGMIDLDQTPMGLLKLFEDYENIVQSQMFTLVDEMDGQIDSLGLHVITETGEELEIEDLQVFPTSRRFSFRPGKRAEPPAHNGSDESIGKSGIPMTADQDR
jgi:hypothetical protein